MDEYINRDKLLRDINHYHLSDGKFQHWVEVQPAADVAPVVHGRWIYDKKAQRPYCSVCKGYFYGATNSPMSYCPNCGTKMDEGKV